MLFTVKNNHFMSIDQLRTDTLLNAYYVVKKYPLHATDLAMNEYLQQQYKISLKDMSVKLLLNLTFYTNNEGDLVLVFKNPKYDQIARLITYGNGAIPGSKILQMALK